jgi:hypothetical protein
LKDRVAVHHAARAGVEHRPVQRMGHGADEAVDGAPRQARVGVEGDHVADAGGHVGRRPPERERRSARTGQEIVELVELSALALPAHPRALAGIPGAPAMKQESGHCRGRRTTAGVEAGDAVDAR